MDSGSEDQGQHPSFRYYLVGVVIFMIVVVLVGFGPTYFGPLLTGDLAARGAVDLEQFAWVTHLHGIVFSGWLVLLLAQVTLVARGNTATHMKVGPYGFGYGGVVLLVGLGLLVAGVLEVDASWADLLFPQITDLVLFAILVSAGYIYRKSPDVHKRMMLFSTIVLLHAAIGFRMNYIFGGYWYSREILFPLLVGLICVYDFRSQGRIHPATIIGTVVASPIVLVQLPVW